VETLETRTMPSITPLSVAQQIVQSPESYSHFVTQQYQTLLGRTPDTGGLTGWVAALQHGMTFEQLEAGLASSPEYIAQHGGMGGSWVSALYGSFLGRTAGQSEIDNWLAAQSAGLSPSQVALGIVNSPEGTAALISNAYQTLLGRAPEPGAVSAWQSSLQNGLGLAGLEAALVGSPEFYALKGATDQGFISGVYQAVLGRSAGDAEITSWLNALTTTANPNTAADTLVTLHLKPLDIKLLGLEVQTNDITVTVRAQPGNGQLLGNLLTTVSHLINLQGVNTALNNVLGSVVDLLNSASLAVNVDNTQGPLVDSTTATTPVLDLFVAPVHLNLLGALVDTTPIHLTITANSGPGLILGNVIADLANLFNPPLPSTLNLDDINNRLQNLIGLLDQQIPNITGSPTTTPTTPAGSEQILSLTVPPINVNLLGLVLKTSQIQVNADALTGDGQLLGNVLTTLLNTLGATPENLTALSNNLNALLGKVIGVLNTASLLLPANALDSLTQVLQTLALPDLVNTTGAPATAPILNLTIASADGTSPPVNVDLLGLKITTSNIQAQLLAQTGDGQILGNLLYNVAHLLDPGGSLSLLGILGALGL